MRYSYYLHFPEDDPHYNDFQFRWQTFLGRFVLPVYREHAGLRFWCSFYASFAAFRVQTDDERISKDIQERVDKSVFSFDPNEEISATLVSDLGQSRFIDQSLGSDAIARRAELVLDYLSSITRLYLEGLVEVGDGRWTYRTTTDRENPNGSDFESLHHLLCNISRVPTMIQSYEFTNKNKERSAGINSPFAVGHIVEGEWDRISPLVLSTSQPVVF